MRTLIFLILWTGAEVHFGPLDVIFSTPLVVLWFIFICVLIAFDFIEFIGVR